MDNAWDWIKRKARRARIWLIIFWGLATGKGTKSRFDFWWTAFVLVSITAIVGGRAILGIDVEYAWYDTLIVFVLGAMFWHHAKALWVRAKILRHGSVERGWLFRYMLSPDGAWKDLGARHVTGQMMKYWNDHPMAEDLVDPQDL